MPCACRLRYGSVGGTSRAQGWAACMGVKAASLGLVLGAAGEGQDETHPGAFIQIFKQCLAWQLIPHHTPSTTPRCLLGCCGD